MQIQTQRTRVHFGVQRTFIIPDPRFLPRPLAPAAAAAAAGCWSNQLNYYQLGQFDGDEEREGKDFNAKQGF